MTESDNIRQMRKMNFLNKTANKNKTNLFGTVEKEEKSSGFNLFGASDIKKPIVKDLKNEFEYESSGIKDKSSDNFTESKPFNNKDLIGNENTVQNLNNTFYSQGETKSVNYKEIFEKQIYYDKLLSRINNYRSFIFVFSGVLHYFYSTSDSLKVEYFSNIQLFFSLMIIIETLLGMILFKLKDNKKKSILDKLTNNDSEADDKNMNLMKFSKVLSYSEIITPIISDFLTLFFVNFLLICYYSN